MPMIALVLAFLHLYVGMRLLSPFGLAVQLAGAAVLVATFALMPKGFYVRGRGPWSVMLPWITMGFFSWLLVLTMLRDVSLAIGALVLAPALLDGWIRDSAIGVMAVVPVVTLIGYFMARRTAAVVHIDVPLADLPAGL